MTATPALHRLHLSPPQRELRIQRVHNMHCWIVWSGTNDYVHGIFYRLYDAGHIERVQVHPDGSETITDI